MLLQPSVPLTPLGLQLEGTNFKHAFSAANTEPPYHGWATYTSVRSSASSSSSSTEGWFFWTVVSFSFDASKGGVRPADAEYMLQQSDLSELVDEEYLPPASFSHIPHGAFRGAARARLPGANGTQQYVWWRKGMVAAMPLFVAGGRVSGAAQEMHPAVPIPITFAHHPQQTNVAPVLPNGAVLLGEAGKVTAVSVYRMEEISHLTGTSTVHVSLRGEPGETVHLLVAHAALNFEIRSQSAVLGEDGRAVISV